MKNLASGVYVYMYMCVYIYVYMYIGYPRLCELSRNVHLNSSSRVQSLRPGLINAFQSRVWKRNRHLVFKT